MSARLFFGFTRSLKWIRSHSVMAPGLENLLDLETRSVLRTPSPVSPDLGETRVSELCV